MTDPVGASLPGAPGPEKMARCLDEIVKVMCEKGLALDILVSEIQDWLTIAGYDVPLRSYDPRCAHRFDSGYCVAMSGHDGPHVTSNAEFPHGRGGAALEAGPSQEPLGIPSALELEGGRTEPWMIERQIAEALALRDAARPGSYASALYSEMANTLHSVLEGGEAGPSPLSATAELAGLEENADRVRLTIALLTEALDDVLEKTTWEGRGKNIAPSLMAALESRGLRVPSQEKPHE